MFTVTGNLFYWTSPIILNTAAKAKRRHENEDPDIPFEPPSGGHCEEGKPRPKRGCPTWQSLIYHLLFDDSYYYLILNLRKTEGASKMDKASEMLKLAKDRFGKVNTFEELLFRAVVVGAKVRYKPDIPLDANRIEWICTDPNIYRLVSGKGIQIDGANIIGKLNLQFSNIRFPIQFNNCYFSREIDLGDASIHTLCLSGSRVPSIDATGLKAEFNICMDEGFTGLGEMNFTGARIGGSVSCSNGRFINSGGDAINFQDTTIRGSVFLDEEFCAMGDVVLSGSIIGGSLCCENGMFINPDSDCLSCDGIRVDGNINLSEGFTAKGEVILIGAEVKGDLVCSRGRFCGSYKKSVTGLDVNGRHCLCVRRATINGDIFMTENVCFNGVVDFGGSHIDGCMRLLEIEYDNETILDLRSAHINHIWDKPSGWPGKGNLRICELTYNSFYEDSQIDINQRLIWLHLMPYDKFRNQPYEQLAKVLRNSGQEEDAKKIMIAKSQDELKLAALPKGSKFVKHVLGLTIGFGYRPFMVCKWAFAFILLGSILFGAGYHNEVVTPSNNMANSGDASTNKGTADYRKFNAIIYSLDIFIPLIDFFESSNWNVNGNRGKIIVDFGWWDLRTGSLLCFYTYIHIFVGWVLTTLLAVGLSGVLRK